MEAPLLSQGPLPHWTGPTVLPGDQYLLGCHGITLR